MWRRRSAALAVIALVLAACNPLHTDPVSRGGELEQTSAQYSGPSPAWIEVSVTGAPDHLVYAFALVLHADLTGPTDRACAGGAGGTVTSCTVTSGDVRMPNQRVVPGDGSTPVRLITAWSAERVQIVVVCVDPVTQDLGCPTALRTAIHAVDEDGAPVGDLAA